MTDLTTRLQEIEKLRESATSGPWQRNHGTAGKVCRYTDKVLPCDMRDADADYLLALHAAWPDVVAELARLRESEATWVRASEYWHANYGKLEAERDQHKRHADLARERAAGHAEELAGMRIERDQLRAENERLRERVAEQDSWDAQRISELETSSKRAWERQEANEARIGELNAENERLRAIGDIRERGT